MNAQVSKALVGYLDRPRRLSLGQLLKLWYQRARERRHLAELDDSLLRDMGIDRAAAHVEAAKPFWQA